MAPTRAVDDVDLDIADGEFFALLGPSGCGKTTLLRLVAGFEAPDEGDGEARRRNRRPAGLGACRRNCGAIGMVFQSYALWPHMSVVENVAFSLRVRRVPPTERERRVNAALAMVGLEAMAKRRPHELSGGQRQRVALARCLAMQPAVVLLDEPLANLDVHLREAMQQEFARFHREIGATFIYVTHDQAEAMALADRVAVMDAGRVEQVAPPRTSLSRAGDRDGCAFRRARHGAAGRGDRTRGGARGRRPVGRTSCRARGGQCGRAPQAVPACRRSRDDVVLDDERAIPGRVVAAAYQGAVTLLTIRPDGDERQELRVEHASAPPAVGAAVAITVRDGWILPQRSPEPQVE